MNAVIKSIIIFLFGGMLATLLPTQGVIDGSTRIIPFFALMMAGVFPAMMQTVTVLKGDELSPKAVNEYAGALTEQLKFWARLIAATLFSVGFLTFAVVLSKTPDYIPLLRGYFVSGPFLTNCCIFMFGGWSTVVFRRFIAAYGGIKSLLGLNITQAKAKSAKNLESKLTGLSDKKG